MNRSKSIDRSNKTNRGFEVHTLIFVGYLKPGPLAKSEQLKKWTLLDFG